MTIDPMQERKPWYQSKTYLGLLIAAVPAIAQAIGLPLFEQETEAINNALLTLIGIAAAAYGRAVARGPITPGPNR